MKLSAKAWANMASLVVMGPYMVAVMAYRESLSPRASAYLALASFLVGTLVYQWVYHRRVPVPPALVLPRPELYLAPERLPGVVWLALIPPVVLMLLLWWVTVHGTDLPWRDTWLGPAKPASEHKMYLFMVTAVILFTSLASWQVVYSLARWHGMARAYPYRRERLQWAVGKQWLILAVMIAWISGHNFRMPTVLATACGMVFGVGMSAVIWMGWKSYAMRSGDPQTGTWCYFDFRDPTFFGPRGLNLANGWSWILAATAIAPVLLVEWLLQAARAQA